MSDLPHFQNLNNDTPLHGMMYKFVAPNGGPQKRHQVARACESCRKRKKRCHHADSGQRSTPQISVEGSKSQNHSNVTPSSVDLQTTITRITESEERNVEIEQAPLELSHVQDTNHVISEASQPVPVQNASKQIGLSRYVGDLSPEALFATATSPDVNRGQSLDESIGVWLTTHSNAENSQTDLAAPKNTYSIFNGVSSMMQRVMVPMLKQECLSTLPPKHQLEGLSKIYFDKVHPILPAIDQDEYQQLDSASPEKILLEQAICLAASKNFATRHLLMLAESESLLTCRQFGEKIYGAMRLAIEMGLVTNKFITIQALVLMSQFTDHSTDENVSLQLCGKAVVQGHSMGLHLKGQQDEIKDRRRTTLFCCVWAVDRMDAAFNGHAVLIHERDVSRDLKHCFEQQEPSFRLFLAVVKLLDTVIDLYRPAASSEEAKALGQNFPAFEDIVIECGGSQIGVSSLATIEALYHAVAILSSRSKSWIDPQRSSIAYLRQTLSTSIVSSTTIRDLHSQLTLFPFIPYALSLSLSVAYREMRHSKLPSHRARSRAQFQMICEALTELGGTFWSASTTSEMGKKLLKEMDRVFTVVSSTENMRESTSGNTSVPVDVQDDQVHADIATFDTNQENGIQDFDPAIFDSLNDVDLFGMFDPAFDLDGFDACLEGNLNPGFPVAFQ